ncbi:MAG: hypothetical protein ACR2K2_03550 [Mycobacteriales bacterium]
MADHSGTVTADGDRRVHARELARAAWGLCLLLRPAYTLRLLGDARPDRRARVTVRLLGARHAAQAVLSGPSPGRRGCWHWARGPTRCTPRAPSCSPLSTCGVDAWLCWTRRSPAW